MFISTLCFGQKKFHINIQFVPKLDTNNFRMILNNGKSNKFIPIVLKNGKIEISCDVYSKYAYLNFSSAITSNQKSYFITKEVSSIIFYGKDKSDKDYPFVNGKLMNAIDINNSDESKKLHNYAQKEYLDLEYFRAKHETEFKKNDSIFSIYKKLGKKYDKKCMDFIKLNSNQYYYFWTFNAEFKYSEYTEVDTLLHFFKNYLYPKYKNLFEANYTLEFLKAKTLKINQPAPEFTTTDMFGRKFSLSQLRGKYVLLNFWATWCVPCVAELPIIKKLREDFANDQLEIISISEDRIKVDWENGIKKYGLNWTHVFRDSGNIINKYLIFGGIPLTYLIDKEGKLVYICKGALSDTEEIRKLMIKK
jgi:thiol-disulfide isomerase/thioredoxin